MIQKTSILKDAKYGSFRYVIIRGKVWMYASDIKHRLDIKDFQTFKKINPNNVHREYIETPLGNIIAYLVNAEGMEELLEFSGKRKVYKRNCKEWMLKSIHKIEEKERLKNGADKYQYGNFNSRGLY